MKRWALLLAAFAVLAFAAVVSTGVLEQPRGVPEHIGIAVSAQMRQDSYDVTLDNGDVITIEGAHQPNGLGAPPPVGALVLAGSKPRPWIESLGTFSPPCPSAFPYSGDLGNGVLNADGTVTFRYGIRLPLASGFVDLSEPSPRPGATLFDWVCVNGRGEVGQSYYPRGG